jgi:hypothetical protein
MELPDAQRERVLRNVDEALDDAASGGTE